MQTSGDVIPASSVYLPIAALLIGGATAWSVWRFRRPGRRSRADALISLRLLTAGAIVIIAVLDGFCVTLVVSKCLLGPWLTT